MTCKPLRIIGYTFVLIFLAANVYGDEKAQRAMVLQRLDVQDQWLGDSPNATQWRGYLLNDELRQMLNQAESPDPVKVAEILDRYQSGVRGVNHRRFAAVRRSLRRWLREIPSTPIEELPEQIRSAEDAIVPIAEPQIEPAYAKLLEAVDELDAYLTPGGENGEAWKDYLRWSQLQGELQSAPLEADISKLNAINQRYREYYEGLELDVFTNVAKALTQYIDLRLAAYGDNPQEASQQRIDELAKALEEYKAEPQGDQFDQLTDLVTWLGRRRQAPRLLRQVRLKFAEPNLVAQVSERVVDAGMGQQVVQNEPVTDCILGTAISGQGHTTGDVYIDLVSNEEAATLDAVFTGTTSTRTIGVNGPARIRSAGTTNFEAKKRLLLDADGIRALTATGDAQTSTRTLGVSSSRRFGGRLIERIASRKVAEQKGTGERIAGRHAAEQVSERFNTQVNEQLSDDRTGIFGRLRAALVRRNALPQEVAVSSTDDALHLVWLQAMGGLGAPTASPVVEGDPDVAVRLHETMVNNLAADMLGGHTITEDGIRELYRDMDAELPESLQPIEGKESWSITFARFRPVTVRFEDDRLSFVVRGRQFTSGDSSYPRPMNISAAYRVVQGENAVRLEREGEVVVLPPNFRKGQRLSIRDTTLRNLLIRRFNKMLQEEFVLDRIALPEQFEQPSSMVVKDFQSKQGWLSTDWMLDQTTPLPQDEATANTVAFGR